MASFTTQGRILSMGEVRNWKTQDGQKSGSNSTFILEYRFSNGYYKIQFNINERLIPFVQDNIGAEVEVSFSLYAREWNGKLYNNVDAYKVELLVPSNPAETSNTSSQASEGNNGFSQEDFNSKDADLPF